MSVGDHYFQQLFEHCDDPWAFKQRWYERRKRALTLAALTRDHYTAIFEPGCANGELSAELALRGDRLLCCDTSKIAVDLAKQRLRGFDHVRVLHARLPNDWPDETFDLIVFSELGYYLDPLDLDQWIDRALASLASNGEILACHWRSTIEGCPQTADQVHKRLRERLSMRRLFAHQEEDFLLDLWSRDPMSVAQREGLR
ncbi:class I SAM-dependent methyltransferase [Pseudomonas sp. 10B1]|uniref:class I SAM-dependent methyltransferase n=1 Tax=unclassified Pseudomonas TaxID=196821 RepID=UPI002AB3B5FC|nr:MULTISPECIES: class I SAM-dependent methyltransferase [unclassified Pseudomonas]MDY7560318.1 class I SAM-dependent methyltransferase [Pseudomonas sp. AB6]MEA9975567.1 class I SAM-dependent methyltransferase [Pseudomonas sp. RTS4]MEA9993948.1 class I SAM-dependent methyltransferase [Pseudomonas sp. AA4]MEB0085372.1 class I SAM-dependent methyltransferase [Pseudomonas sp. RTI1]MEB0124434.1 class I SAM-dependent methyltransferase [Pseudomonas sp. CCC1.2]